MRHSRVSIIVLALGLWVAGPIARAEVHIAKCDAAARAGLLQELTQTVATYNAARKTVVENDRALNRFFDGIRKVKEPGAAASRAKRAEASGANLSDAFLQQSFKRCAGFAPSAEQLEGFSELMLTRRTLQSTVAFAAKRVKKLKECRTQCGMGKFRPACSLLLE